ncbi:hypothetical protein RND71_008080 [Anisodus tanguticus]|uniref:Uncharacterized protein n=1 Tax=Anisodus tanguticus TaxID=243964 RepID=A0AAE1SQ60_9SOLA|nr:hypothetical protein RND71_008080 [Anisodus tanguticus]
MPEWSAQQTYKVDRSLADPLLPIRVGLTQKYSKKEWNHWRVVFAQVLSSYQAELPSVRSLNRSFTLSLITDAMDCYLKTLSIQKELLPGLKRPIGPFSKGWLSLSVGRLFPFLSEGWAAPERWPWRLHGSGEGAGGRGFRWTDLFGDLFGSSSPANSEAGANQPAPDSPNPGEPAAPLEPEVYQPLLEDGQRRRELCDRLTINTIRSPLPEDTFDSIIETQFQTELKMEEALRSDRVPEDSILEKRHEIRGVLFYPKGKPFSLDTYLKHLNQIENHGTHRSPPYKKLQTAIEKKALGLAFERIKKRKAWY